jgi:hypothetical protein
LDPPPDPKPPVEALLGVDCSDVDVGGVAVAEEDVMRPTDSPVTEQMSAAATIQALLLFDSSRRTLGQRACSAPEAEWRSGRALSGFTDSSSLMVVTPVR